MAFHFTIEYKAGKNNKIVDALSRRDADQFVLMEISMSQLSLFDEIQREQCESEEVQQLISAINNGTAVNKWSFNQGLLFYNDRVYLPHNSPSIQTVVSALHNQGHEGC